MKTVKKLPYVLAFAFALLAAACSDIGVEPVGVEDEETPIIITPPPKSTTVSADTVPI